MISVSKIWEVSQLLGGGGGVCELLRNVRSSGKCQTCTRGMTGMKEVCHWESVKDVREV